MKSLPCPKRSVVSVVPLCVASMTRDRATAAALVAGTAHLEDEERRYRATAAAGTLHTLLPSDAACGGTIPADRMGAVYKQKFTGKNPSAKTVYDEIYLSARICPLCLERHVKTLDHYLPKAAYPDFALTPINMVPSCSDCNKAKLDNTPADAEHCPIHPYFDTFDDATWVFASVIQTNPISFAFRPKPPDTWPAVKQQRAINHFKSLDLDMLYSALAAVEVSGSRHTLTNLWRANPAALKDHLSQQATSWRLFGPNSWKGAMFEALLGSSWFLQDGLRQMDSGA